LSYTADAGFAEHNFVETNRFACYHFMRRILV
jgi:hypothetical protein